MPDPRDAARLLGVALDASSEDVRSAYLSLVRRHPPDRDPEAFEKLRDAYEALRDPDQRAALQVLSGDPDASLVAWFDAEPQERRFVGPGPWRAAALGRKA